MEGAVWLSTGLIVLLVAIVAGVVGGVCVCMYFYKEGKRKNQIRPADELEPKMVEPFSTKKHWERGRQKAITLTENESIRSISIKSLSMAKGAALENGGVGGEVDIDNVGEMPAGGINPSVARSTSPVIAVNVSPSPSSPPPTQELNQSQPKSNHTNAHPPPPTISSMSATTAVEVS